MPRHALSATAIPARIRNARMATFAGFFVIGAMIYVWSTSVTAFRYQLGLVGGLGDLSFGLIASGIGVGTAAGALVIGRLIDKFGPKQVVGASLVLYPLSIVPLSFVSDTSFALSFGIVLGLLRGASDTALNAHGVQVERFYGRPIMAAFHAFYPLGGFMFGLIGSHFAYVYTDSVLVPFLSCSAVLLVVALVSRCFMLDRQDLPLRQAGFVADAAPIKARDMRVVMLMIGFGLLLLGSMVGESTVADWGQEYLRRELLIEPGTAGLAISTFTGMQFVGRLVGDRVAERFGSVRMVVGSGLCSIAGLLFVLLGGSALRAMLGFGLFGLGVSCIAPLMLSSAGRRDLANVGRNLGIVNGVGYSGMLFAPAVLSLVVNAFGIGALLYFPLALTGLLVLLAPWIMREECEHRLAPVAPIHS
ncbi:MFS transporter [Alcaligenes parafaecalis]|uniref:MFS transporter n=1 Tax=Alcaligenes parafaecalis TaxID=171260 RepID=A0ABT3VIW8_9BURK|nr:MFS transporter [Alcaligenes parafaecalis]MCX5463428.1 MFS transporter [Alcaligenes parafaecalis]